VRTDANGSLAIFIRTILDECDKPVCRTGEKNAEAVVYYTAATLAGQGDADVAIQGVTPT
jgi:hypothetical protein